MTRPRPGRRRAAVALLAGLVVLGGCAPRRVRPVGGGTEAAHADVGIYRGTVSDEAAGRSRRFRLLLYAELPDRLHGEVVSPLGRTELIIDGCDGRLAVSVVRERVAFVGAPEPQTLDDLVGAPIGIGDLVRSLLTGRPAAAETSYRTHRTGAEEPGLPGLFEVGSNGRGLRLELRRRDRMRQPPGGLGTGAPPAGFEQRPLAELAWDWFDDGAPAAADSNDG